MTNPREATLVDVFVQRRSDPADSHGREHPDSTRLEPCLDLHGVLRERSYLARDGQRILCHFRAPDAESLRVALRAAGIDYDALWAGAVSNLPGTAEIVLVVERVSERPLSREQERACRAWMTRRLQELGAEPARVLLSSCRKRVLWLCRAKVPAVITAAEFELKDDGFDVWSCQAGPAPDPTIGHPLGTTFLPQT